MRRYDDIMNIWDDIEKLGKLGEQRDRQRSQKKHMTFDCFNLHFRHKDMRAYCSKGKILGQAKDGSLGLIAVLRGICLGTCKNCEEFSDE